MVFGVWTHGDMQGISTNSKLYPEATQYVNAFLKHHAAKRTYSSFVISINTFPPPHPDPYNSPDSLNLNMSYRNFTGGELWIAEEGTPQPTCDPVAVGQWRVRKMSKEHEDICMMRLRSLFTFPKASSCNRGLEG